MRQEGFSLAETLVAFAILALALGALFAAQERGMRALQESRLVIEASSLARAELSRISLRAEIEPGVQERRSGRYLVRSRIAPYAESAGWTSADFGLNFVKVDVYWVEGGRRGSVSAHTLRAR